MAKVTSVALIETVTVEFTKREAALLTLLSGYVATQDHLNQELYDLLKVAGARFDFKWFDDAEDFLGVRMQGTVIKLAEVDA